MSRHGTWFSLAAAALIVQLVACSPSPPVAPVPDSPFVTVARGRIDVEGGLIAIEAAREGIIRTLSVHEGQTVAAGQPLLTLDLQESQLVLAGAVAAVRQAHAHMGLIKEQLAAAKVRAQRLTAAAQSGAGDVQSADDAAALATQLKAEAVVAAAELAGAEAKAESARHEISLRTLRSPAAGTVVQLQAQVGTTTRTASGALLTLLPTAPRIVRAELNESYVGLVQAGLSAQVSAEDEDTRLWQAKVLRISPIVTSSQLEDDPQRRASARTVECVLSLDAASDLRVGQRVLVRFVKAATEPKG